jgi:hypothetical protein
MLIDGPTDAQQPVNRSLDPTEKWAAPRNERDVESLVHVADVLGGVKPVGVDEDGAVAINASTEEVGEIVVRNGELAEREALRWCESNAEQPIVESSVAPLQAVNVTSTVYSSDNAILEPQTTPERFQQLQVLGWNSQMATVRREVSIGGDEPNRISQLG